MFKKSVGMVYLATYRAHSVSIKNIFILIYHVTRIYYMKNIIAFIFFILSLMHLRFLWNMVYWTNCHFSYYSKNMRKTNFNEIFYKKSSSYGYMNNLLLPFFKFNFNKSYFYMSCYKKMGFKNFILLTNNDRKEFQSWQILSRIKDYSSINDR